MLTYVDMLVGLIFLPYLIVLCCVMKGSSPWSWVSPEAQSGGTSVNQTVNAREASAWLLLGVLQDGHPVLQSGSHHHESGRGSLDHPPKLRGATVAHSGMQGMSVLGKNKTLSDI